MKKLLSTPQFIKIIPFFLFVFFTLLPMKALSFAENIVISEVQIAGDDSLDEFVELYNPTTSTVDLSSWRLTRKTAGGSETNLVASISGEIAPYGYFLIANPNYDGLVTEDLLYSATTSGISANNTVLLYSDAGVNLIDKVGLGTAGDFEASATANPATHGSIERKALVSSTASSMGPGGEDENLGNGEDTDDNFEDFVLREISDPQNSNSATESALAPTPTTTPTEIPTPTVTPMEEPTPTPSLPQMSLVIGEFPLSGTKCGLAFRSIRIGFIQIQFPFITCQRP